MRMRKKRRGSERLLTLSSLYFDMKEYKELSGELFFEEAPLRLEIGCGKGDFICGLSVKEPGFNYIAMEKIADVAMIAGEKYARSRNLGDMDDHGAWVAPDGRAYNGEKWDIPKELRGNVRFTIGDAADICECFSPGTFDTVYANFSDPWQKGRYAERRLTHPAFLKRYLVLLRDGGYFRFKTDNADLFEFSLESVRNEPGFELTFVTRDLHSSERAADNIMTEYERNFSEKGVKINCLEARKK